MSQQLNLEIETTSEAFELPASSETLFFLLAYYAPGKYWKMFPAHRWSRERVVVEAKGLATCWTHYRIVKVTT